MGKPLASLLFASLIAMTAYEAGAAAPLELPPAKKITKAKMSRPLSAGRDIVLTGSDDLRFELSWSTCDDLDLHVFEPSGFHIFWDDDVSPSGGALVRDENASGCETRTPTEVISWPSNSPPSGVYTFFAHFYDSHDTGSGGSATYTMKVISGGVVAQTFTATISQASEFGPEYTFNYGGLPQILSFTANPTTIAAGDAATLTWTTQNATSVSIHPGAGGQPGSGSVTVAPEVTTTYVLTATGSGGTVRAAATVNVTGPRVIAGTLPSGFIQQTGAGGGTDTFTLSNIGEAATTVTLAPSGGFFTISPNSFELTPGSSRTVTINGIAQSAAGFREGTITATGTGVRVPAISVRMLVTAPRVGSVKPQLSTSRVEVSGAAGQDVSGTVEFTNSGTAELTGIAVADVPWIVPQSGVITIPAGQTRSVAYTIDSDLRPDGAMPAGAAAGILSLVYVEGTTTGAASETLAIEATATGGTTISVSIVHVVKPNTGTGEPDPLGPGELALFASGLGNRVNAIGDLLLANRQNNPLSSVQLFVQGTGAGSLSASIPQLLANSSLAFPGLLKNVFSSPIPSGTAQVRGADASKVSVAAIQTNTSLPVGTYSTALPIFRSDRAVGAGDAVILSGVKKDSTARTDLFIQEASGQTGTFTIEYLNGSGQVVGTLAAQDIGRFGFVELLDAVSSSATAARIRTASGAARLVAFGLVTNPATGDAWPVTDPAAGSTDSTFVMPILRPPAGGGIELFATNRTTSPITVTIDTLGETPKRRSVRSRSTGSSALAVTQAVTMPLAPGQTTVTTISAGSGYLRISGPPAAVSAAARSVRTIGATAYGSGLPVVPTSAALGLNQGKRFAAVDDASETSRSKLVPATYRTHLALVETSGQAATVRVSLQFTFPGGSLVTAVGKASKNVSVAGGTMLMIRDLAAAVIGPNRSSLGDLRNMTLDVEVISGNGRVVPFLQSIDNGSGDMLVRTE